MNKTLRWIVSVAVVIAVALAWTPWDEKNAVEASQSGLRSALLMHAVARGMGAALAVAQGTRVAAEPLGMGVELAPGEIVQPLRELVEQLAAAMLAAAMLFGIQMLLAQLGAHWSICLALTVVAIALLSWWWARGTVARLPLQLLVMLLLIRFAIPVTTSLSGWLDERVLKTENQRWEQTLQGAKAVGSPPPTQQDLGAMKIDDPSLFSISGLKELLAKLREAIVQKGTQVRDTADRLVHDVEGKVEAMVSIAVAYLVRAIVLPLLFGLALVALLRSIVASLSPATAGRSAT